MRRVCRVETGFTLLEMVFVLFVIGLLVGLVAPRIGVQVDRFESKAVREEIEDQIRQLPRRIRLTGRSLELPKNLDVADIGDGQPVLSIPSGWIISFEPPLLLGANGACTESRITLKAPNADEPYIQYRVAELSCELSQNVL
jgi:prepilin-type N-terminal cleavage/methylation domain-containing protein